MNSILDEQVPIHEAGEHSCAVGDVTACVQPHVHPPDHSEQLPVYVIFLEAAAGLTFKEGFNRKPLICIQLLVSISFLCPTDRTPNENRIF
ncbi:hypothetical protein T265_06482 [Opisthorchis viverrini]|uniref:Uncharacterized protein n=1 Tax=Opisthorchis viverrini TaxID=6198 RepID=A0A075ADR0_OPIVI|nr:hypothetical protein T265_06482 [Opisthorchis viverrini]KER26199.1 hypothetical protein T265_06482 [Opisthorchis viverrini]